MKPAHFVCIFVQCTWGILQTALGFCVFLRHIRRPHRIYRGAVVTQWRAPSSVSLGLFLFLTDAPPKDRREKNAIPDGEILKRLLVHEYGHSVQSLLFGPLYLPLMGLPSALWGNLPRCKKKRAAGAAYDRFFTERLANYLGEKATGEKAMKNAVL